MKDYQEIIDKYYPPDTLRRVIYMRHCTQVADLALETARNCNLPLDPDQVRCAAMLHDIGICLTEATDIGCEGTSPYIMHGLPGADLRRKEGMDEAYARVAERHTGAGITAEEVTEQNLPLPVADYMPETLLEQLICYADKFYSKGGDMKRKTLENVRRSMERISQATLQRFNILHTRFTS